MDSVINGDVVDESVNNTKELKDTSLNNLDESNEDSISENLDSNSSLTNNKKETSNHEDLPETPSDTLIKTENTTSGDPSDLECQNSVEEKDTNLDDDDKEELDSLQSPGSDSQKEFLNDSSDKELNGDSSDVSHDSSEQILKSSISPNLSPSHDELQTSEGICDENSETHNEDIAIEFNDAISSPLSKITELSSNAEKTVDLESAKSSKTGPVEMDDDSNHSISHESVADAVQSKVLESDKDCGDTENNVFKDLPKVEEQELTKNYDLPKDTAVNNDCCEGDSKDPQNSSLMEIASSVIDKTENTLSEIADKPSFNEAENYQNSSITDVSTCIKANVALDDTPATEEEDSMEIKTDEKAVDDSLTIKEEGSSGSMNARVLNSPVVDDDVIEIDSSDDKPQSPQNSSVINVDSLETKAPHSDLDNNQEISIIDPPSNDGHSLDNPLQKLNEHIKTLGEHIPNHSSKTNISSLNNTPDAPRHRSNSHCSSACDKENKVTYGSERNNKESSDSFVYTELSKEETGFPDAFTGLVTVGKYISVKGDFTLRSSEALLESPSMTAPYLLKEPDAFPPKEKNKESKNETKDFFHSAAGEILIGIGISRVNEWFHKDMIRIKKRQMKRSGKTPELEQELATHENNYSEAKKANSIYSFSFNACKTCGFTSESSIVLEGHLLVPHVTQRREFQCNFCDVINRDPKAILDHMEVMHGKIGRIQPPVMFFECPFCPFESNSKVKVNNHLIKCQRCFEHTQNQAPPRDFEVPCLTPKPITVAVVKAYEKSLGSMQKGRGRPKKDSSDMYHMNRMAGNSNMVPIAPNQYPVLRPTTNSPLVDSLSAQNQVMPPLQMPNLTLRPAHASAMSSLRPGMPPLHVAPPNRYFQVLNSRGEFMPVIANHMVSSPSQFPFSPTVDSIAGKKTPTPYFSSMFGNNARQPTPPSKGPPVSITPLPKLTGPYPVPMAKPSTTSGSPSIPANNLVVCEICDGYIKDLEQLRTHMQLIHKVKIHPKMLVSRPPLNCQKCQWRFFTDQGLERHLLGAHGLVTSNMQELANKGKDAGCCTICGRVFGSKLVSHINTIHKITLKPAHLSYKCTVCSATFNLYRLFENHVYLVHSGAAKRSSSDGRSSPTKRLKGDSLGVADGGSSRIEEEVEKCLQLSKGALSTKTLKDDELIKKENKMEKAAA